MNSRGLFKNPRCFALGALWLMLSSCGGGGGGGGNVPSAPPPTPVPGTPAPDPGSTPSPTPTPTPSPVAGVELATNAAGWEIGPIIDGKNYSLGLPLHPTQNGSEWYFDFPLYPGKVGYLTYRFGPLSGRSRIVMKYRIEMDPATLLHPPCCAAMISVGPTPYFQRKNDDWNTDGYRWWASYASPMPIEPGEHEITVQLDGPWTSVFNEKATTDPSDFRKAKDNADRVGFTFGGGDGLGHGLYTDGPARFVLESFRVE
jgi:hypothetical protein